MIEQAFNPFENTLKKGISPIAILFIIGMIALIAYIALNEKGLDNVKNLLKNLFPAFFKGKEEI